MSGTYDSPEWRALRAQVCHPGARCVYCGSTQKLNAHHLRPRIYGGADIPSNLVPVCDSCHPFAENVARLAARLQGHALRPLRVRPKPKARVQPVPRLKDATGRPLLSRYLSGEAPLPPPNPGAHLSDLLRAYKTNR